tara:strand:- start:3923 stop:6844 length:2922 start_codon:yes stop_codon:yes gene_type:complete
VGYSDGPTTVTLSIVDPDGVYAGLRPPGNGSVGGSLSSLTPYDITIEAEPAPLRLRNFFLVSWELNEDVQGSTLSCTFKDGSILLDKIQVLLYGKMATPLNLDTFLAGGVWNGFWTRIPTLFNIPIQCGNCLNTGRPPWGMGAINPFWIHPVTGMRAPPWSRYAPFGAPHFGYDPGVYWNIANGSAGYLPFWGTGSLAALRFNPVNGWPHPVPVWQAKLACSVNNVGLLGTSIWEGGTVIIGMEEFTSSECQLPNVTYTFRDLINHITGNQVGGGLGINVQGLHDRGKSHYKQSYTGTLREVLASWCADFGFTFVWDWASNSIIGIDLTSGAFNLGPVRAAVYNTKENTSNSIISNTTTTASLEGTYLQDHLSTYVKSAKLREWTKESHTKIWFQNLRISDLMPERMYGGRTEDQLYQSAALGRYSQEARTLYNFVIFAQRTSGIVGGPVNIDAGPLGLKIKYKFSQSEKERLLDYNFSVGDLADIDKKYGKNCTIFLGEYSKAMEDKWIDWEAKVEDFFGRYYFYTSGMDDFQFCNDFMETRLKVTTTPESKKYSIKNIDDLPFKDLLKHPGGVDLFQAWKNNPQTAWILKYYIYDRDAAWGRKDEEIEYLWENRSTKESTLKDYIPSFEPIAGQARLYLLALLKRLFPNSTQLVDELKTNKTKEPVLIFCPDPAMIYNTGILQVGTNRWGFNNLNEVPKEADDDEPDTCETVCESDIFTAYCVCPEDTSYVPELTGLLHYGAWGFWVSTKDSAVGGANPIPAAIIYPCMSAGRGTEYPQTTIGDGTGRNLYQGYVNYNWSFKRTVRSITNHFGTLGEFRMRGIVNDSLSYKVNVFDMTPDLDEMDNSGAGTGKPDPSGRVGGTLTTYIPIPAISQSPAINSYQYAQMIYNPINNSWPAQTFSFKMVGLDFRTIAAWMNPQAGLNSMSIGLDENGVFADISFATRPPALPKQDLLLQKVGARINVNQFARMY